MMQPYKTAPPYLILLMNTLYWKLYNAPLDVLLVFCTGIIQKMSLKSFLVSLFFITPLSSANDICEFCMCVYNIIELCMYKIMHAG